MKKILKSKAKRLICILAAVLIILSAATAFVLAKYSISWHHEFGLIIRPADYVPTGDAFMTSSFLTEGGSTYSIKGVTTYFTISNGYGSLDGEFSSDDLSYTLSYYIDTDGDGTYETLASSESDTIPGGAHRSSQKYISPITYDDKVYSSMKIVATSDDTTLFAIFNLGTPEIVSEYSYADGVIFLSVRLNYYTGVKFTWADGIAPDNSDPNFIFTYANASDKTLSVEEGQLTPYMDYTFCFFVTSPENFARIEADINEIKSLVTVEAEN